MDPLFASIEASSFSVWLRESSSVFVFPFILILHTWGLAFLVGANVTIGIRGLGFVAAIPLHALERYYLVMWVGFWVNAVSGLLLLIAYPTKALTNPLFYVKLLFVAAGMYMAGRVRSALGSGASGTGAGADDPRLRMAAGLCLACWAAAIPAGRFLAYTCTRLTVEFSC